MKINTISERPLLSNTKALEKYFIGIATQIFKARCHFKNLVLSYFIGHVCAATNVFIQMYMINYLLENIFWIQRFSIFETFVQPHFMRSDPLAMFFPYEIEVMYIFLKFC